MHVYDAECMLGKLNKRGLPAQILEHVTQEGHVVLQRGAALVLQPERPAVHAPQAYSRRPAWVLANLTQAGSQPTLWQASQPWMERSLASTHMPLELTSNRRR